MKRLAAPLCLAACLTLVLAASAYAVTVPSRQKPVPATPELFNQIPMAEDIRQGTITVELGLLSDNPKWALRSTAVPVLVRLISDSLIRSAGPTDNLWKQMKAPEKTYKGLTLRLVMADGHAVQPLRLHNGKITTENGRLLVNDYGRRVEFWLFSSARVRRDQQMAGRVLPVLSFEQCRLLGNQIVETAPRQCLLPDGGLMLETTEVPTANSLKAVDFDSCLKHGQSLIYTFPRRCVAAGGRVFTEPPRVYEPSPTIVLSTTTPDRPVIRNKKGVPPTVIEERQGLGRYAVSPATPAPSSTLAAVTPTASVEISATIPVSITVTISATVAVSPTAPDISVTLGH